MSTAITAGIVLDAGTPLVAVARHDADGICSVHVNSAASIVSTDPDALDRLADALKLAASRLRELDLLTAQRDCLDAGDRANYEHRYLDHDVHGDWSDFCADERASLDAEIAHWSKPVTVDPIERDQRIGAAA